MFERFFGCLFPGRRLRQRRELADRLLALLDSRGAIVFNANTVEWLGRGRREAFLLVCHLAIRERIHLETDDRGRLILLSTEEFRRRLQSPRRIALPGGDRSDTFLVAAPKRPRTRYLDGKKVMRVDMTADCLPPDDPGDLREVAVVETGPDDPAVPGSGERPDGWFKVVVTSSVLPDDARAPDLPDMRQSLPDRPREPWISAEWPVREKEK